MKEFEMFFLRFMHIVAFFSICNKAFRVCSILLNCFMRYLEGMKKTYIFATRKKRKQPMGGICETIRYEVLRNKISC